MLGALVLATVTSFMRARADGVEVEAHVPRPREEVSPAEHSVPHALVQADGDLLGDIEKSERNQKAGDRGRPPNSLPRTHFRLQRRNYGLIKLSIKSLPISNVLLVDR